jgi:hypothetical protein
MTLLLLDIDVDEDEQRQDPVAGRIIPKSSGRYPSINFRRVRYNHCAITWYKRCPSKSATLV